MDRPMHGTSATTTTTIWSNPHPLTSAVGAILTDKRLKTYKSVLVLFAVEPAVLLAAAVLAIVRSCFAGDSTQLSYHTDWHVHELGLRIYFHVPSSA